MDSNTAILDRTLSRFRSIGLILGVLALLVGQVWISAVHWLQLPPNTFESMVPLSCSILPICSIRYPPYFAVPLVMLLIAGILLAVSLRRTALRITRDLNWSTLAPPMQSGQWRTLFLLFGALAVAATALGIYSALMSDVRYPDPLIWFAAILLWGVTFFSYDRSSHRASALTRAETFGLLSYVVLLGILGLVYHTPILQSLIPRVVFVFVMMVGAFALWRGQRISGIAAVLGIVGVAGLALYTYNIASWRYSFIGDEYAFYNTATSFLGNPDVPHLLSSRGVYDAHPVFSILIQAITVGLYGGDMYGWRFSGILMVFLSVPAIYVLVRQLKGPSAGLMAVIVYLSAHHVIAFTRVGSNNVQALPVFSAMLAFAVLALDRRSMFAMFLAGLAGAFAFFTIIVTIPLIPLPLLLLALWVFIPSRELPLARRFITALPLAVVFVVGVVVTAYPRLVNTVWLNDVAFTTVARSEMRDLSNPFVQQIIPNAVYSLGASLYFDTNSHYTSGAHLDPLTSVLMLAGIAGLIAIMTKRRVVLWLLTSFLITTFFIGGLVPYAYPANSRTFLLVLFYGIFAGFGAAYLWEAARDVGLRLSATTLHMAFTTAAITVIVLNVYQFFYLSERDIPKTSIPLVLREFQDSPPDITFYHVARVPEDGNLMMVLLAHGVDLTRIHPVLNPSPTDALSEVRGDAIPPYRVLIALGGWEDSLTWLDAAQTVWPDRLMKELEDDFGAIHYIAIDVPSAE